VQEAAAYVLGTAAANNEKFQGYLLKEHPGVVKQLLKVRGERQMLLWLSTIFPLRYVPWQKLS
jgi:hypothetical protein